VRRRYDSPFKFGWSILAQVDCRTFGGARLKRTESKKFGCRLALHASVACGRLAVCEESLERISTDVGREDGVGNLELFCALGYRILQQKLALSFV
jgi:hypothetical protein